MLENPGVRLDMPQELTDLRNEIYKNAIEYGTLPAVDTYDDIGRKGIIDDSVAKTRWDWFMKGKPTSKEWFQKWFGDKS